MTDQVIQHTRPQQELPPVFAAQLRTMYLTADKRLNRVLAEARHARWWTSTLAAAIGSTPQGTSKRIERAAPPTWQAHMREQARVTERDLEVILARDDAPDAENGDLQDARADLDYLLEFKIGEGVTEADVRFVADRLAHEFGLLAAATPSKPLRKRLTTLQERILGAIGYVPEPPDPVEELTPVQAWQRMAAPVISAAAATIMADVEHLPERVKVCRNALSYLMALERISDFDGADLEVLQSRAASTAEAMRALRARVRSVRPDTADTPDEADAAARLHQMAEFTPTGRIVDGVIIPAPRHQQLTQQGAHIPDEEIVYLRGLQKVARNVNGTTKPDSPEWKASRELSERLYALAHPAGDERGLPPYYLAKILGVTHRAIITRLERHEQQLAAAR